MDGLKEELANVSAFTEEQGLRGKAARYLRSGSKTKAG